MPGYLLTALLLWSVYEGGWTQATDTAVKMARCRATCMDKFLPSQDPVSCRNVADCHMCWDICLHLFTSYSLVGAVCKEKKICTKGCVMACKFRQDPPTGGSKLQWTFLEAPTSETNSLSTKVRWTPPVLRSGNPAGQSLVYILLVRQKNSRDGPWKELTQLAKTKLDWKSPLLPDPPEFQIMAVSKDGVVAKTMVSPQSLVVGSLKEPTSSSYTPDIRSMNVTVHLQLVDRELVTTLQWSHPGREVLECAQSTDRKCFYNIHWFQENCAAYDESPPCEKLHNHEAQTRQFYYAQSPNCTLPDIDFNSAYRILVKIRDVHGESLEGVAEFKTPLCKNPGIDSTQCLDDLPDLIKEQSGKDGLYIPMNITDGNIPESITADKAKENPMMTLIIDENPKMTFNQVTKQMDVNVTWSTMLNQTVFEKYEVTWISDSSLNNYDKPQRNETSKMYMVLHLEPDQEYNIKVIANYMNDKDEPRDVPGSITINTQKNFTSVLAQPIKQPDKQDLSTLSGVIVGVVVATILIVVGFIVLFYKKRKSFKDIIITKTFVTKSNSYKSNVGAGKSNYSNQLMIVSDEWELDPKLLKFSTPLGQGAFGKVVTGYYSDRKVAIKLVKEGAPLSYKEDLVAEINLMKRIGSHPNIVSLIGACTITEPIALVMEYVPQGNLQNFLKKCRMEGDLRKRTNGSSEIIYSMVHESGGVESGVINPTDMLSFARQVAMAMEYLTDRKYVHRDLAARNVLIDYNKVVKVCDFGLSRDIYNDNQYKKLTNGKLPLKWMAIESLRDRIFTTQTDVWSFGILLWEIVTMGASPYPHIALADLYYVLVNGYRMEITSNCSNELYAIMSQCWAYNPQDRPCFTQLRLMLEELLEQDRDYLVLENINVPLNTSENSSNPSMETSQPSGTSSGVIIAPLTKEELRVNVCIHEKSTDRLLRKSESDSSP